MKIFNWVHRKFHHKDGFGGNVKKSTETECQVLLENVTLVEVLGGWIDGILTIGTFGFDPSTDFDQKNECPLVEEEEEEEDDDDDDMKECDDEEEQSLLVLTVKADLRDYEVGLDSEELEGDMRKKKRITLADLFVADSDLNEKPDCGKVLEDFGKKVDVDAKKKKKNKKKGFSSAKKFIPGVGDDTSPIKKLHQKKASTVPTMAEISEAEPPESSSPDSPENNNKSEIPLDFDPNTIQITKPGLKRLILSLTVLFSFFLGLPFLLKSIEIYRTPLPFRDIDSLSNAIKSTPLVLSCRFHAVFVGFDHKSSLESSADKLGFSILGHMTKFTGDDSLMKRMMKRKIHPDLEEKFEEMDSQMKPTTCGLIAHGYGTSESVSLLQTKVSRCPGNFRNSGIRCKMH
ncbi:unnamed protein product [Camellia sinensis]